MRATRDSRLWKFNCGRPIAATRLIAPNDKCAASVSRAALRCLILPAPKWIHPVCLGSGLTYYWTYTPADRRLAFRNTWMATEPGSNTPDSAESEAPLEHTIECASGEHVDTDSFPAAHQIARPGIQRHQAPAPTSGWSSAIWFCSRSWVAAVWVSFTRRGKEPRSRRCRQTLLTKIPLRHLPLHVFGGKPDRAAASLTHPNIVQVYQVGE